MPTFTRTFDHPGWNLPEPDKTRLDKVKDQLRTLYERPAIGRTTPLGRKVEKPGDACVAGPSGQKGLIRSDCGHTNK